MKTFVLRFIAAIAAAAAVLFIVYMCGVPVIERSPENVFAYFPAAFCALVVFIHPAWDDRHD